MMLCTYYFAQAVLRTMVILKSKVSAFLHGARQSFRARTAFASSYTTHARMPTDSRGLPLFVIPTPTAPLFSDGPQDITAAVED